MSVTISDDECLLVRECARNSTNNDPNETISDKGESEIQTGGQSNSASSATTSSGKEYHEEFVFEDYIRRHLKNFTWYHGVMFGNIVDKLLKWEHSFLVRRVVTKNDKFLCISVKINNKIYHFRLNQDESGGWTCPKLHEKFPNFRKQRFEHIFEIINAWSQVVSAIIAVPRRSMVLQHDCIVLEQVLGQGAFGQVFKAKFTASGATASIEVAAKKALGDAKRAQIQEFCHESSIMAVLQHENVVAFYGIASLEEPIIVLMELVTGGDLERYLKSPTKISKLQMIYFALNIANGMRHVSQQKVIHRDLAARNCLITQDLKVKISDFGMSRMGPELIEKSIKKAPIRWMAPESLTTGVFNEKTDVWSFGVLVTEMMTRCAHKPLWPMNIKEAQEWIKTNERPHHVEKGEPRELLGVVDACCEKNPEIRYTFQTAKRCLRSIYSNCLNGIPVTSLIPSVAPTSGVVPLEMKKSTDRQKTITSTLSRKKSRDGVRSSKSKKSAKKRRFLSFRRKGNKGGDAPQGVGYQLPTGMSALAPSPQSLVPLPPPPPTSSSPNTPPTTSAPLSLPSPSQNTPPQGSAPATATQSKSPTTQQ